MLFKKISIHKLLLRHMMVSFSKCEVKQTAVTRTILSSMASLWLTK